ncbi:MAG: hypothetical protein ACK519_11480, partial [Sphingomonadaceae bacterium]
AISWHLFLSFCSYGHGKHMSKFVNKNLHRNRKIKMSASTRPFDPGSADNRIMPQNTFSRQYRKIN